MNNDSVCFVQRYVRNDNHRVEICYRNIENAANLELVSRIIEECSFLFPGWLRSLCINVYDTPSFGTERLSGNTR